MTNLDFLLTCIIPEGHNAFKNNAHYRNTNHSFIQLAKDIPKTTSGLLFTFTIDVIILQDTGSFLLILKKVTYTGNNFLAYLIKLYEIISYSYIYNWYRYQGLSSFADHVHINKIRSHESK